jgi:hypothetical protein
MARSGNQSVSDHSAYTTIFDPATDETCTSFFVGLYGASAAANTYGVYVHCSNLHGSAEDGIPIIGGPASATRVILTHRPRGLGLIKVKKFASGTSTTDISFGVIEVV